jgi:uncharacterized protein (TIGR02594 family)
MKPDWLRAAEREIGTHEIVGPVNNARIVEYASYTTLKAQDDETPWCSAFICWCFEVCGIRSTRLANARSWLNWGAPIAKPVEGCVVILKRGAPPSGHVCLFIREQNGDMITCLGGNQGNQVKYSHYPKANVLGYRWPVQAA